MEDIAAALSQVLYRSGIAPMNANLSMGGFKVINLANGSDPQDAATFGQLSALVPVGMVLDYAGTTAPTGYLLCYGQAVSRSTYASLFNVIGTNYGAGDGSTTFNLPDLRGRVVAGKDDMGGTDATRLSAFWGALARTIGGVFGTASHILTLGQMPKHNHGGNTGAGTPHQHGTGFGNYVVGAGSGGSVPGAGASFLVNTTFEDQHTHPIAQAGNDEAHTNTQPTIIMNKIIRAG